jgi:hypothetical protein
MKLDPNFLHHRKITRDLYSDTLFARPAGSSRSRNVIVAAAARVPSRGYRDPRAHL